MIFDLHSSMDRLETIEEDPKVPEFTDLHSSMDRLETSLFQPIKSQHSKFTFQYG